MMSVLGAGAGCEIDLDDLGLKKHYRLATAGLTSPTYNDLMIEVCVSYVPCCPCSPILPSRLRSKTRPYRSSTHIQGRCARLC